MIRSAAIDIGSQTIRLLVADYCTPSLLKPVRRSRAIVRLGEGISDTGRLKTDAVNRAVNCIAGFVEDARHLSAEKIYPVATACVRHADNRNFFLDTVCSATGLMPEVLSGQSEALLSLRGVQSVYPDSPERSLVIDVGGGSTEFCLTAGLNLVQTKSIPLGVIGLSEKYLIHDPPLAEEISRLNKEIRQTLESCLSGLHGIFPLDLGLTLIGTAGTLTTLAAMDLELSIYNPVAINGHRLQVNRLKSVLKHMLGANAEERAKIPGLESGRAKVILPGTLIVLSLLDLLQSKEILVSDAGLLEGILLSKINVT